MNLGRVAILKPDHLGDLVIASPAIKVLSERIKNITLLVSPASVSLAQYLFPGISIEAISFHHLSKLESAVYRPSIINFDTIIALREDSTINIEWLKTQATNIFQVKADIKLHESEQQRRLVSSLVGSYEPLDYFGLKSFLPIKKSKNSIGLCISCGHSSNSWSLVYWKTLAVKLMDSGHTVFLIGGPQEAEELNLLSKLIGIDKNKVILGSSNIENFLSEVSKLELIIATDSGSAHLCSLVTKIYSLFGPSSPLKYSPLGKENKVFSLNLNCSPCLQFAKDRINLCVSRECLNSMTPQFIWKQFELDTGL